MEQVKKVDVRELNDFKNHPFEVNKNGEFYELVASIEKDGILVPLLARPNPYGEGYELISGHRRKAACAELGINTVPVLIEKKLEESNPTLQLSELTCGIEEDGLWKVSNIGSKKGRGCVCIRRSK